VLDAHLRVVLANSAFYRTFQVTPDATQGQLLYELGKRQWDIPALRTLLKDDPPAMTSCSMILTVKHPLKQLGGARFA
jgi:hypothetical protein